jgi:hypothetical protein
MENQMWYVTQLMITSPIQPASEVKTMTMNYYLSGEYAKYINHEIEVNKKCGKNAFLTEIPNSLFVTFSEKIALLGYKTISIKEYDSFTKFIISWDI